MIGIVKLFPIEAFLTRELQLFVWNERLNSICIRVLLQKRGELVMNEVFTKRLCVEAKKSRWETSCQQLWTQHWLHSKWWPGRGVCELKKKLKWVVHIFKRCQWKRGVVSKKNKKVGQSDNEYQLLFLRASWQLSDLILHIHVLSTYFHEYRPPPAYRLTTRGYVRHVFTSVSFLDNFPWDLIDVTLACEYANSNLLSPPRVCWTRKSFRLIKYHFFFYHIF